MSNLLDVLQQHDKATDKRTFGLVLPGGGMRAAYSAGAVSTLLSYGLVSSFDHVVGVSAGAIHGAYFLANDNETMRNTYPEDLTNKNFINLMRADKKVDIDYLIDLILKHKHPLNFEKLKLNSTKLHIVLTDAVTGKKRIISDHQSLISIYEELRATSALPLLYDKQVLVMGHYFIDGAVADNLPVDVALEKGCTDIVVILNRKLSSYSFNKAHQRVVRRLVRKFARKHTARVRSKLPTDEELLQVNLRLLKHPTRSIRFYILEPSNEQLLIGLSTTDKEKVKNLCSLGVTDMDKLLTKSLSI